MVTTHKKDIRQALSRATCALLGATSSASLLADSPVVNPWDINMGFISYLEQDRNTGIEFLLDASRTLTNDDQLRLGVEIDTLTGATPNGATASNVVQTFTRSSGAGSYFARPGELPADDTHMDTRLALGAGYQQQLRDNLQVGYDGKISMEFDYLSFVLSNNYQLDLNQNTSTLYFGLNSEYNRVHPVGNIPDALSLMTPEDTPQNRTQAATTRSALEAAIGWTQVLDQRSLVQVRLTRSQHDGYLNDPYKLLSIISTDDNNPDLELGSTLEYRYERRPRERNVNTLYLEYKRHLGSAIVTASARHSRDNWEVEANTVDLRYRHILNAGTWIEPHLRFYEQSAAEFYRHSLPDNEDLPEFATADFRLGEYQATTLGLNVGFQLAAERSLLLAAEYYRQKGESKPASAIGLQREQDLFPTLHVGIIKLIYSMRW